MSLEPSLTISGLQVCFDTPAGKVRALDDVSFSVGQGEIVAIVGESGSGKSVTALSILKLIDMPPGRFEGGEIRLADHDILSMSEHELVKIRGSAAAMLFQNPRGSLDPSFTIQSTIEETLARHQPELSSTDVANFVEQCLRQVGFHDWQRVAASYPHQLSGGMCQRVAMAVALACKPRLLIADEPTTALDVGVQAKVLYQLRMLNREQGLPIILITHDFGVVRAIGQRVIVMYAGQIQEEGSVDEVLKKPMHPYTQALIRSVPEGAVSGEVLYQIPGTPPDLIDPPPACRFADRCEAVMSVCRRVAPQVTTVAEGRRVRCHLYEQPETANEMESVQ
ncbi:ABC transporter ATP-binding protein [Allohahella marinimesophila]|uniref:ABC-type dipeptide transporter n=1 Tax=Allohahella marinimesophila TaxID=1054972 RepID=A0ABP7NSU1_9GAMM